MSMFKANQTTDYPLKFEEYPLAYIRYLYTRSSDSRTSGSEGQDYLAWQYLENKALDFVICDGVGSSFYGNIAARYLGEKLLDTLLFYVGARLEEARNKEELMEIAAKHLNDWQEEGQRQVEAVELPPDLPALTLKALEGQREYGSETVFVCGRLSLRPSQPKKLFLIWMGDTQVRLFDRAGKAIPIEGLWRNSDRWSTKSGIKRGAILHTQIIDIDQAQVERIMGFSDGLLAIAEEVHELGDDQLREKVDELYRSPSSDDISFIDIRLKLSESPGKLETPQFKAEPIEGQLNWPSIPGAEHYQLQEAVNGLFYPYLSHSLTVPAWSLEGSELPPETIFRYYRVQALAGEESSPWSRVLAIGPASPFPGPKAVNIEPLADDPSTYTISWEAVEGARYYILLEKTEQQEREAYSGPGLSHTLSNQAPGVYHYYVQARGPAGQFGNSDEAPQEVAEAQLARVEADPPKAVQTVFDKVTGMLPGRGKTAPSTLDAPCLEKIGAVKAGQAYTIRWSEVDGADTYELQEASEVFQNGQFNTIHEGSDPLFECPPKIGGKFHYQVRAKGKNRESTWSKTEQVEIEQSPMLSHVPDREDEVKSAHSSTLPSGAEAKIEEAKTQVRVISSTKLDETITPSLDVPQVDEVEAFVGQTFQIRWPKVSEAYSYELQMASDIEVGLNRFNTVYEGRANSFSISYPTPVTRFYRVRALGKGEEKSDWSQQKSIEVKPSKLDAPRLKLTSRPSSKGGFIIEWSPVPGADWYELDEAKQVSGLYNSIEALFLRSGNFSSKEIAGLSVELSKKEPGTYHYRVRACSKNRKKSDYSNPVPVVVPKPLPGVPDLELRHQGHRGYLLTWTSVGNAFSYHLYESRFKDLSQPKLVYKGRFNRFEVLDPKLGVYFYGVCSSNKEGDCSEYSNIVNITVSLGIPEWQSAGEGWWQNGPETVFVRLIWSSMDWAEKYELFWTDGSDRKIGQNTYLTQYRSIVTAEIRLMEGVYKFFVRALDLHGRDSDWSRPKKVLVYRTPQGSLRVNLNM